MYGLLFSFLDFLHLSSSARSGDAINNQRRVPGKTIRDGGGRRKGSGGRRKGSGEEAVMLSVGGQSGINCIGIESRSAGAGLLWLLVRGRSDRSAPLSM